MLIINSYLNFQKKVSTKLRELSLIRNESEAFLKELAQQVEDFSVTLMQQISTKEESSIDRENVDSYASLLDDITASAIRNSQKKVRHLNRH